VAYDDVFKDRLRRVLGPAGRTAPGAADVERAPTLMHADAGKSLTGRPGLGAADVDIVGFHGHTVHHDPKNRVTVQLGDGQLLADWLGISVACDFRSRDVPRGARAHRWCPCFMPPWCAVTPMWRCPQRCSTSAAWRT